MTLPMAGSDSGWQYGKPFLDAPLVVLFTALAVIFLPFTKALTLDIGFPFKLYEAFFPFAILFLIAQGDIRLEGRFRRVFVYAFLFWTIASISSIAGIFDATGSSSVRYRGGRTQDAIMRSAYLLFNICVMFLAFYATKYNKVFIIKAWLAGFLLAFSYHVYTVVFVVFTGDAYLLPGLDRHQMGWMGPLLMPRSGTFEEGNFAGLYYLATLAFAMYARSKALIVLAVVGVAFTLSTAAYIGLFMLFLVNSFKKNSVQIKKYSYAVFLLIAALVSASMLGFDEKFSEGAGASGAVRLNESMTGLQIFYSNPTMGVGLGGYGFLFDEFEWSPELSIFAIAEKHIPNNVYVELLSETGLIGSLLFLIFFVSYIRILSRQLDLSPFYSFGLSAAVVFMAYPTFNITYLWFFIGASLGLSLHRKTVSK